MSSTILVRRHGPPRAARRPAPSGPGQIWLPNEPWGASEEFLAERASR